MRKKSRRSRPAIYRLSDKVFEQTGYIEGRNVIVEYRWTQGQYDRAPALSVDLVPRQVSVLVANSLPLTLAAKAATTTIPLYPRSSRGGATENQIGCGRLTRTDALMSGTDATQEFGAGECRTLVAASQNPCAVLPYSCPHNKELPMRQFFHSVLTALSIACLAASFGTLSLHPALAQIGSPMQMKQIALTQKQIDDAIASQKDVEAVTQGVPRNAPPNSKVIAKLDGVAKKHGFASFDEYNTVIGNISIVMDGIDPQTKKYIGSDAGLKQQVEEVKANKQMSAANKKKALADLDVSRKFPDPEVQNKGNIDLVIQNYDKIDAALGGQPAELGGQPH